MFVLASFVQKVQLQRVPFLVAAIVGVQVYLMKLSSLLVFSGTDYVDLCPELTRNDIGH